MSLLRKIIHKSPIFQSTLAVATCFFTTPANSFPENPTAADYDILVNAAGESRDFDNIHHLLNKRLRDHHCFNTANTFKFLTNDNDASSLSLLLDDLTQTLSRLDSGFTRKSAYDSLVSRLCKLERVEEALRVVDLMARENYGLNACTFHPILNLLTCKPAKMDEARRVVEMMRKYGVSPDLTAFNYFLMAYCFAGDLARTAEILSTMEEDGVKADTRTYDALVFGACKAGKVDGAMVLLRRMIDDRVPVLLSTHVYVIDSLLRLEFYAQAVKFVREFSGKETQAFGSLGYKLVKLERFDEANQVLDEMRDRGLVIGDKLKNFYESKTGIQL